MCAMYNVYSYVITSINIITSNIVMSTIYNAHNYITSKTNK